MKILLVRDFALHHGHGVDLEHIGFSVMAGECVVIRTRILLLGTSLLQGILGLAGGVSGEVWFDGRDLLYPMPRNELLALRRKMGYVQRVGGLISLVNVQENIALPLGYHSDIKADQLYSAVAEVAEWLEITELLRREVDQLDVAEVRLVTLARALISRPRLLLVDAVLEGMDVERKHRAIAAINHYQETSRFGVLMTSREHGLEQATRLYELHQDGLELVSGTEPE